MLSKKNYLSFLQIICIILFLLITLAIPGSNIVLGDALLAKWQNPINLALDTNHPGWFPKITSDAAGNVHVFWMGDTQSITSTNESTKWDMASDVIYYRFWDGKEWSLPVDIIASNSPRISDAASTKDGRLVILWSSQMTLNISQAPIIDAQNPRAWKTVTLASRPGLLNPQLAISNDDTKWYITFSDPEGVFLITSNDGLTWGDTQNIWESPSGNVVARNGGICISPKDGSLNITWSETFADFNWGARAIGYARFISNTIQTREVAFVKDKSNVLTMDWPIIHCSPNGQMMIFWNNGVGSAIGRFYQVSEDNGLTWENVGNAFMGQLSGQTGSAQLVEDSESNLHLVTSAYGPDGLTGMRYAQWNTNSGWSDYQSLWPEIVGESPSLTVTHGNQLHLVWYSTYYGGIFYTSATINAPDIPVAKMNTAVPTPPIANSPTRPEPVASETPIAFIDNYSNDSNHVNPNIGLPIAASVIPIIILLVVIIVIRQKNTR
jgi:hypothetical protein